MRNDKPPPSPPTPEAALCEPLGNRATGYSDPSAPSSLAPFCLDQISWPTCAGSACLVESLPESDRSVLTDVTNQLLLPEPELAKRIAAEGAARTYWDPELARQGPAYLGFVRELSARRMVRFRRSARRQIGCFFLTKKSGKLRLLIDARGPNQAFRSPPRTSLASTAAMVEIEVPGGPSLWLSAQDIVDCFYQFDIPDELAEYFGLFPVEAGLVGVTELDGEPVSPRELIVPCICVLPMGMSWALHWAQQAHRELLSRANVSSAVQEIVDRRPPPPLDAALPATLIYVDNELFVSTRAGIGSKARRTAEIELKKAGLPMHDIVDDAKNLEILGMEIDGVKRVVRLATARRWRLRLAVSALLRRKLVTGQQLEIIIGHFTHAMLLNRPSLSVFRAVYDFSRRYYRIPSRLWDSVRKELRIATALLPMLCADWNLEWSPEVSCSDAATNGWAAHESSWPAAQIRQTGGHNDRWRFKIHREGGASRACARGRRSPKPCGKGSRRRLPGEDEYKEFSLYWPLGSSPRAGGNP